MLLLFPLLAAAATPTIALPDGAGPEWRELARRAGFDVVADSATASVRVVTDPAWTLLVRSADGAVRVVGVDAPVGHKEQEDLLFLAASLVRPVTDEEEWTHAPARAVGEAPRAATTRPPPAPLKVSRIPAERPATEAEAAPTATKVPRIPEEIPSAESPTATKVPRIPEGPPSAVSGDAPSPTIPDAPAPMETAESPIEEPAAPIVAETEHVAPAPARARPWATLTLGAGWEPAMPVAGYGALAGGVAVDWLVVGLALSAETPRSPASLPATLDVGTAALRAGWRGEGIVNPVLAVDVGVARRHFAGDGVDPVVTLPFVAINADIGVRLGHFVFGPQARVSVDLAPVVVRVGGDPRVELSRFGVDAGVFLSFR